MSLSYESSGVNYDQLDAFKRACQRAAKTTADQLIESLREKNKVVYYDASSTVRVKILPGSEISRSDFHAVKEWINTTED